MIRKAIEASAHHQVNENAILNECPSEFELVTLAAADATIKSLKALVDVSQIVTAEQLSTTVPYAVAYTPNTVLPPIVSPRSADELRSLMTWAAQDRKTVLVCGQGSKLGWGTTIPSTDFILSTRNLNQIVDHAVGDLTVTVQTGISFQDLQAHLKTQGQMLPLDPSHPSQATLGGILSTRDTGSLRQRYGSVRELCLGLSFVRADGELAKGGGRVVKNVAGYDLMKLLTGAFGSLGILSEVTLRLYPMQEESQTVVFGGSEQAIAALTANLLDSTLTPVSIDLLSQNLVASLNLAGDIGLAVRFQSLKESVLAQVNRLKDMGSALTEADYQADADEQLWTQLRESLWTKTPQPQVIAKFGILPQSIPHTLQTFQQWCDSQSVNFQAQVLAGWGIGTLRLSGENALLQSLVQKMRTHCEDHQGYLTLLEAPTEIKQVLDVWGYPGNAIAPMQKLKAQFDPHNLLNPGRFVGGL